MSVSMSVYVSEYAYAYVYIHACVYVVPRMPEYVLFAAVSVIFHGGAVFSFTCAVRALIPKASLQHNA